MTTRRSPSDNKGQPGRTARWKLLERVVAAIEHSVATVEGTAVTANAKVPERLTGKPRQVDVLVQFPASGREFRIAVEVRDYSSPLSLPQIEGLISKLGKLDVDKSAIVAQSGFSEDARAAVVAAGIEALDIKAVELPFWWEATNLVVAQDLFDTLSIDWVYGAEANEFLDAHSGFADEWQKMVVVWPNVSRPIVEQLDQDVANSLRSFLATDPSLDGDLIVPLVYTGTGCTFQIDGQPIPLPDLIRVRVQVRRRLEDVPLAAYQRGRHLAVTGVSDVLGRQFTFVVTEVKGGGRRLSLAIHDPNAKPLRVSGRHRTEQE